MKRQRKPAGCTSPAARGDGGGDGGEKRRVAPGGAGSDGPSPDPATAAADTAADPETRSSEWMREKDVFVFEKKSKKPHHTNSLPLDHLELAFFLLMDNDVKLRTVF